MVFNLQQPESIRLHGGASGVRKAGQQTRMNAQVNTPQVDRDIEREFDALQAGDPGQVAAAFLAPDGPRGAILRRLLDAPRDASGDATVAAAFSLIWQDLGPAMTEERMGLLKWYVAAEASTKNPDRRAALANTLTRLTALDALPLTDAGRDLGFVGIRAAVECGGPQDLRRAAGGFLQRMAALWTQPTSPPPRPAMLLAAIQSVDLTVMRAFIDRLPDAVLSTDLRRAVDWATGLFIEFAGIDPWLSTVIERQYRHDPQHPAAAQRKAQLGLHQGRSFAAMAPMFHNIRCDPSDISLKPALQFAYWQAENETLQSEIDFLADQLRALDPGWGGINSASPSQTDTAPDPLPHQADLAALVDRAARLCAVDLDLASPFTPAVLRTEFESLAQSISTASMPAIWTLPDILQAAQRLIQIDRREVAWIVHFADAPHGQGLPHYGSVDLARFPALHAGLMTSVAALCQIGLDWVLAGNRVNGNAPIARLAQIHTRASLENDRSDAAEAFLDRFASLGILTDVLATLRDDCRMQRGDLPALLGLPPRNREGSAAFSFLDHDDWSRAEGLNWTEIACDPAIAGRFELVWPDGQREEFAHLTPPGHIATAHLPGLRLIAEDMLIGPNGNALRPDTYHTSAEFPWDSAVVVASGKRALRLRPVSTTFCAAPVMVLEAFEALRWRNYYHWVIPILSRVALAQSRGLLDHRLLVVPEGLSGWMKDTLALIGLTPDRQLVVPLGQEVRFADAVVLSSIEHVSLVAVQALRDRLLGPHQVGPQPKRALFLSRSGQKLRKLQHETDIENMARAMGFEVIAPQDFTVAEQIRLFSQADGIAAVEGAALTNTVFCPPGTRVLAMLCVNDMMPIFNDLSIVLGHHHRKLAGRGLTGLAMTNRFQPPFAIDLELARQSLAWVMEA